MDTLEDTRSTRSTRKRWGSKAHRILMAVRGGSFATDTLLDLCLGNDGPRGARACVSKAERERFYKMLSYLKREGLLEKRNNKKDWELTKRGLKKLTNLEEGRKFTLDSSAYVPVADTTFRIVIFDIPEKEREKRKWIRGGLFALGFEMCQKSVWLGKRKIPKRFVEDLRDKGLLACVHIFEISKKGSLSALLK